MTASSLSEMLERQRPGREHRHVEAQRSGYLDGELSETDHRVVHDHVAVCRACRQELDEIRRLVQTLASLRAKGRRDRRTGCEPRAVPALRIHRIRAFRSQRLHAPSPH